MKKQRERASTEKHEKAEKKHAKAAWKSRDMKHEKAMKEQAKAERKRANVPNSR
jgi:hypothetical protein